MNVICQRLLVITPGKGQAGHKAYILYYGISPSGRLETCPLSHEGQAFPMLNPPQPAPQSKPWREGSGEEPPSQRATPAERLRQGLGSRRREHQPVASDAAPARLPRAASERARPRQATRSQGSRRREGWGGLLVSARLPSRGSEWLSPARRGFGSPLRLQLLPGSFGGGVSVPQLRRGRKPGRKAEPEAKRPPAASRRAPPRGTRRPPGAAHGAADSGAAAHATRDVPGPPPTASAHPVRTRRPSAAPRVPSRGQLGFPGSPTRRIARSARPPGAAKPRPLPGWFHPSGELRGDTPTPHPRWKRLRGIGPPGGFPGTDAEQRRRKSRAFRLVRLDRPRPPPCPDGRSLPLTGNPGS